MARIKVLEVVEAAGGGVLRHLFQIIEHLDRAEFEVTVAVSPLRMEDCEGTLARLRASGAGVELVSMKRRIAPLADTLAVMRLARVMRRGRFDIVHAHSSKAGAVARAAARLAGLRRVFYTPHAFAFQCGGVAGWFYRQFERLGARLGGTIVAVSEGERALAVENRIVSPERVVVIRNAVEALSEPTSSERADVRAALGLPPDCPVVGTVGRLARQKGCADFIRAAERVLEFRPDARFVLIGPGEQSELTELAAMLRLSNSVLFAGQRSDAARLCAALDVYVQPSLWEGLSYALLDAMGRGLPVVATAVPGNTDLVRQGETGLLVPPASPFALADAVLVLLAHPDRATALGRAARELVLARHNLADFIRAIRQLYGAGEPA